jgi:hypothetical protein
VELFFVVVLALKIFPVIINATMLNIFTHKSTSMQHHSHPHRRHQFFFVRALVQKTKLQLPHPSDQPPI